MTNWKMSTKSESWSQMPPRRCPKAHQRTDLSRGRILQKLSRGEDFTFKISAQSISKECRKVKQGKINVLKAFIICISFIWRTQFALAAVRKFKTGRGELYMSNDTRLYQKLHLRSYLMDTRHKVDMKNDWKILLWACCQLMYCWNYKVASSFLMSLMFKSLTNGSELELGIQPWTLQNSMSPRTVSEWRQGWIFWKRCTGN